MTGNQIGPLRFAIIRKQYFAPSESVSSVFLLRQEQTYNAHSLRRSEQIRFVQRIVTNIQAFVFVTAETIEECSSSISIIQDGISGHYLSQVVFGNSQHLHHNRFRNCVKGHNVICLGSLVCFESKQIYRNFDRFSSTSTATAFVYFLDNGVEYFRNTPPLYPPDFLALARYR